MSDEFMGAMSELATEARAAGEQLEREGHAINLALKRADALAALIIDRAQSEELSTHVEISFEPHDAALIANQALAYQRAREGALSATLDARESVS